MTQSAAPDVATACGFPARTALEEDKEDPRVGHKAPLTSDGMVHLLSALTSTVRQDLSSVRRAESGQDAPRHLSRKASPTPPQAQRKL